MGYKSYRMKSDSTIEPSVKAGTIVYDLKGWDYGLANDDTRAFNREHTSVTLNSNGDHPSFTVPVEDLEVVEDNLKY
jgi:hypothetical protein